MEELKDVVLNVYSLSVAANDSSSTNSNNPQFARTASFLTTRLLPSLGMGAYHTSLELDGYNYTFAAGAGIVKTSNRNQNLPLQASFQEAIPLGSCRLSSSRLTTTRQGVASILKISGEKFFTPTSYHLVHRNCNHFTETLATALIMYDELLETSASSSNSKQTRRLTTYPDWINRLASTGAMVISHDADIVPCNVWNEAAVAVGATTTTDNQAGQPPVSSTKATATPTAAAATDRTTKKTLTEAQKKMLAKLRKK